MEVKAIWQGGRAFEAKGASGYPMVMDATANYGGEGKAPTPTEMLLSSLAGCIGIDVTMILKPHLEKIESIEITVDGARREELPTAFTGYTLLFDVKGVIDAKKVIRAIKLGEEKYCAVSASLKAEVTYRLILNGEDVEIQTAEG
ncbi:OsmC family protein [Psychrobacillus lasiicapitis]|uniref:OsmC family protein n=1 Tax=Psychrobacillus lasiicapitis TaxID=1636719 RepID=A0A544THX3_9BACI|nr:OsmC family protein [Psychrobacillus lasiicapitis]TQR17031.1 OsmC family protein [Psychrobacillus lasiicapitis]GGA25122.1 peroxiredoxin [Psychrobacillus lasiicapitis]